MPRNVVVLAVALILIAPDAWSTVRSGKHPDESILPYELVVGTASLTMASINITHGKVGDRSLTMASIGLVLGVSSLVIGTVPESRIGAYDLAAGAMGVLGGALRIPRWGAGQLGVSTAPGRVRISFVF